MGVLGQQPGVRSGIRYEIPIRDPGSGTQAARPAGRCISYNPQHKQTKQSSFWGYNWWESCRYEFLVTPVTYISQAGQQQMLLLQHQPQYWVHRKCSTSPPPRKLGCPSAPSIPSLQPEIKGCSCLLPPWPCVVSHLQSLYLSPPPQPLVWLKPHYFSLGLLPEPLPLPQSTSTLGPLLCVLHSAVRGTFPNKDSSFHLKYGTVSIGQS